MKILITGADGFIGKKLSDFLAVDYEVYRCSRKAEYENINCKKFCWDISEKEQPDKWENQLVDIVIHVAALSPSREKKFADYYQNNVVGTQNVINFARKYHAKKIIYFGAVSSFGMITENVLKKDTLHIEPNDYGLSKFVAQKLIENSGVENDIIILPGVVGLGCHSPWIIDVACKLRNNMDVSCYNKNGLFNNVVEVEDLCHFIKNILYDSGSHIFILGNRDRVSIQAIMEKLKEKFCSLSKIHYEEDSKNGFVLDVTNDSRYSPKSMEEILDIVCKEVHNREEKR